MRLVHSRFAVRRVHTVIDDVRVRFGFVGHARLDRRELRTLGRSDRLTNDFVRAFDSIRMSAFGTGIDRDPAGRLSLRFQGVGVGVRMRLVWRSRWVVGRWQSQI